MANMELIEAKISTSSSVTFTSIPQTYTDLQLVISSRTTNAATREQMFINPNGSTTNNNRIVLFGYDNTTPASGAGTDRLVGWKNGGTSTANTFSNISIYFPNYTSSNNKSFSTDAVAENNSSSSWIVNFGASLWSSSAAITSIEIACETSTFASGSTFYLYGISNVTSGSKATGGIVSSDGTYWYHTFPFSGTFTPTQSLTADYLVVAGGGGGAATDGNDTQGGGGGGAGGLRSTVTATGGGGSLETAVALTSGTAYTITIGSGGNGGDANTYGTNTTSGGNSSIAGTGLTTITSTGGGRAGNTNNGAGAVGGSGGGGNQDSGTGAAGTANQGYAGANAANNKAGGGGGAGGNATVPTAGSGAGSNGGIGVQITAFAYATQTGANSGYYAGGGGGNAWQTTNTAGVGGLGGGGNGTNASMTGVGQNGVANTGGGGGGSGNSNVITGAKGGNGGSGLVIIRYAI